MQLLEFSGAVRPIYGSLGVKRLNKHMYNHKLNRILFFKLFSDHGLNFKLLPK